MCDMLHHRIFSTIVLLLTILIPKINCQLGQQLIPSDGGYRSPFVNNNMYNRNGLQQSGMYTSQGNNNNANNNNNNGMPFIVKDVNLKMNKFDRNAENPPPASPDKPVRMNITKEQNVGPEGQFPPPSSKMVLSTPDQNMKITNSEKTKELQKLIQQIFIAQAQVQLEATEIQRAQSIAASAQQSLEESANNVRIITEALHSAQETVAGSALRAQKAQLQLAAHDQLLFTARQRVDALSAQMVGLQAEEGIEQHKFAIDVPALLNKLKEPLPDNQKPTPVPSILGGVGGASSGGEKNVLYSNNLNKLSDSNRLFDELKREQKSKGTNLRSDNINARQANPFVNGDNSALEETFENNSNEENRNGNFAGSLLKLDSLTENEITDLVNFIMATENEENDETKMDDLTSPYSKKQTENHEEINRNEKYFDGFLNNIKNIDLKNLKKGTDERIPSKRYITTKFRENLARPFNLQSEDEALNSPNSGENTDIEFDDKLPEISIEDLNNF